MEEIKFNEIDINEEELIKVTTTLPRSVRDYLKSKGYKLNDLIRLGALAKQDNPQLISRIKVLEDNMQTIRNSQFEQLDRLKEVYDLVSEIWNKLHLRE